MDADQKKRSEEHENRVKVKWQELKWQELKGDVAVFRIAGFVDSVAARNCARSLLCGQRPLYHKLRNLSPALHVLSLPSGLLPLVFRLRLFHGLPLHVRWRIRSAALERYDMVNDMSRPAVWVPGFPHELPLRRRAPGDLPIWVALHQHRTAFFIRGSWTNARLRPSSLVDFDARSSSVL